MESKFLTIVVTNTGILCLNAANELNTFTEDKIYEVDCGDPRIKEQIKPRRVLECRNGKTRPLPSFPHVVTINRLQVLLNSITCLPSYPIGRKYLPYSSLILPSICVSSNPQMTYKTPSHFLYPGYKSGLRTPFSVGSPLSWPAVLTVSLTLINFISLSFCLMSGNSFPTHAQTTT